MKKTSKFNVIILFMLIVLANNKLFAQNVALNKQVQTCIQGSETPEHIKNNFDFSNWIKTLHLECDRMISRVSSEKVEIIAQERETVNYLASLAKSCEILKPVQSTLEKIQKIYAQKIKAKTEENKGNLFESEGSKTYTMTLDDAKDLKKNLEIIIKKLKL